MRGVGPSFSKVWTFRLLVYYYYSTFFAFNLLRAYFFLITNPFFSYLSSEKITRPKNKKQVIALIGLDCLSFMRQKNAHRSWGPSEGSRTKEWPHVHCLPLLLAHIKKYFHEHLSAFPLPNKTKDGFFMTDESIYLIYGTYPALFPYSLDLGKRQGLIL